MIVYVGFTVWTVGCGCLSMVTESTPKALLVFYMVLAGFGAGQVSAVCRLIFQHPLDSWNTFIVRKDATNNHRGCSSERLEKRHVCSDCPQKRTLHSNPSASYSNLESPSLPCQFVRQLGGTLSLAVGSTLMCVCTSLGPMNLK